MHYVLWTLKIPFKSFTGLAAKIVPWHNTGTHKMTMLKTASSLLSPNISQVQIKFTT